MQFREIFETWGYIVLLYAGLQNHAKYMSQIYSQYYVGLLMTAQSHLKHESGFILYMVQKQSLGPLTVYNATQCDKIDK